MTDATNIAFVLHIGGGTLGLVSGLIAISARKGERLHRRAGSVFVASMLIMAATADVLAVIRPGQLPNLLIGTFTLYLLMTAWLTVKRPPGETGLAEKIAFAVILLLFAPFAILSFQLAFGLTPYLKSAVPLRGPVLVAIFIFTFVTGLAAAFDAKVLLAGGIAGRARLLRHLWRMCFGLALAAGSAFTNGFPRLLPAGGHVPLGLLFVPQLFMFGILFFWVIRVRFTAWYKVAGPADVALRPGSAPLGGEA
ncbi:MAG TPA: DUF2306 domain-containing protein [Allosphingosinicella sp.]|nr:DUF2306 domain-containing protein [Allosphingosinicella sp.]